MPRHKAYVPHGVIPAVLLPFHDDLSIDEAGFRKHLRDVAATDGISAITLNAHSTEVASCTFEEQQRVHAILDKHGLDYDLTWTVGGLPFLTPVGKLSNAITAAIKSETGLDTELSTTGGTSDGRFIAQICPQVVEFGPTNASIHKIDEHVALQDIDALKNIYRRILERLQNRLSAQ